MTHGCCLVSPNTWVPKRQLMRQPCYEAINYQKILEWWPRAGLQEDVFEERTAKSEGTAENSELGKRGRQHHATLHTQTSHKLPAGNLTRRPASMPTRHPARCCFWKEIFQPLTGTAVKHGTSTVTASASVVEKRGRGERRFSKTNRLKNTAQ